MKNAFFLLMMTALVGCSSNQTKTDEANNDGSDRNVAQWGGRHGGGGHGGGGGRRGSNLCAGEYYVELNGGALKGTLTLVQNGWGGAVSGYIKFGRKGPVIGDISGTCEGSNYRGNINATYTNPTSRQRVTMTGAFSRRGNSQVVLITQNSDGSTFVASREETDAGDDGQDGGYPPGNGGGYPGHGGGGGYNPPPPSFNRLCDGDFNFELNGGALRGTFTIVKGQGDSVTTNLQIRKGPAMAGNGTCRSNGRSATLDVNFTNAGNGQPDGLTANIAESGGTVTIAGRTKQGAAFLARR